MDIPERSKHTIQQLIERILPKLANRIHDGLSQVIPLFQDYKLENVIDTWTRDPHSNEKISLENGNIQQIGLRLLLDSFTHAGANTFDLSKNLIFSLDRKFYTVGPDKNTIWLEKPYDESWTNEEYDQVTTQWCNNIVDELTNKLNEIS